MNTATLRAYALAWSLSMKAERKSKSTRDSYETGVRLYLDWCDQQQLQPLARTTLRAWMAYLMEEQGKAPATAMARLSGVRSLVAFLVAEDDVDLDADPFAGIKGPKIDEPVTQPLETSELAGMLKACQAPKTATYDVRLLARRDEAIIRLMMETGARAGEVIALTIDDVDLQTGTALIRKGKGGKTRAVPFTATAALALTRYLGLRGKHKLAATDALWLGTRGGGLTYYGLRHALARRAEAAGVQGFHPHRMRHTLAHRWLAKGGSESGLMAVAGWTQPAMMHRYSKAQASQRAADESRRLNLDDLTA